MTWFLVNAATIDNYRHCEPVRTLAWQSQKGKRDITKDFYKVPIGFGMALAMNEPAMTVYSRMTEEQKQAIINKAHNVRSEKEMYALVMGLANDTI